MLARDDALWFGAAVIAVFRHMAADQVWSKMTADTPAAQNILSASDTSSVQATWT
ncbi:hypothetical protein [Bradyrhizobium sp. 2TAF24]|uniref:hypothetical protein n=1 Tax=Bradyrhizobium sp. 2TAF24 TaxID=3233011 RepID=UPI003F8DA836